MPKKPIDLTGFRKGDLEFLRLVGKSKSGNALWECKCHRCGGMCVVPSFASRTSMDKICLKSRVF